MKSLIRLVLFGQGIYYILTGLWPILSPKTFMIVTGPKSEIFLLHTVGALAAAAGVGLTAAAIRRQFGLEIYIFSAGMASAFAAIDIIYYELGRLWAVYLLDALAEIIIIVLITILFIRSRIKKPDAK